MNSEVRRAVVNRKVILIPIVAFVLSFIIEILANKVSFFSLGLAFLVFWTSLSIAALLVLLELFSLVHSFIEEHFQTPMKKARAYRERIKKEQQKIKELLAYEVDGKPIDNIRNHYYRLEECNFSKEALAPYLLDWYAHVSHTRDLIEEENQEIELEDFRKRKAELQQDIQDLENEKKQKQASEEEQSNSKRTEFLNENQDRLFFYTEELNEEEQQWLAEEGFERTHQWDIFEKESKEMMVKTRSNESISHAYLIGALHKHLQDELGCDEVKLYETKLPDIVFFVNGFEWAIEVETGSLYKKNKKELKEKVELNNKKYKDGWFFVVTNKNLIAKYRAFGDTVDRNGVLDKIEGIIYPEGTPTDLN